MSVLISLVSLIITIIIYFASFRLMKKKKNISWDIKRGLNCYSCKESIVSVYDYTIDTKKECFDLCKSCSRDESIDSIINNSNKKNTNRLKRYLISKKSDKIIIYYIFIVLFLFFLDFFFVTKFFSLSTGFLNILYAIVSYYRISLVCGVDKEKPLEWTK